MKMHLHDALREKLKLLVKLWNLSANYVIVLNHTLAQHKGLIR